MIHSFFAATEYQSSLHFQGGGSLLLDLGVWALGAFIVLLTWMNHRRLKPTWRRVMMVSLRALLVALLLLFYYQPTLLREAVHTRPNALAILVDKSQSMGLPHGDKPRKEWVASWLERHQGFFEAQGEKRSVHVFDFGKSLLDGGEPGAELDPEMASATDFTESLGILRDRFRNRDLGGVILLTDGIDTAHEGRRKAPSPKLQNILSALQAPVSAVTMAGDPGIKDISVTHLSERSFAYLLNATQLEATLEVHGFEDTAFEVRLLEDGVVVATQMVQVDQGEPFYKVTFDFVPSKIGKHVYTVRAEVLPDEIYAKNNERSTIIHIIRDKIRVVQIVGQPSWDERHLRHLLKENPNVDLVSFFIMVNRFSNRPLSARETSLIPFPAHELFAEQLGGFDLVIFQNFNYGPFQTREYLPNIARYVRDGGAFLMVGGPLSLSAGGYYGTELMDILPVDIPPGFRAQETLNHETFQPTLTDAGRHHPITRLVLDPIRNAQVWQQLPELEGANIVTGLKDGALSLVTHPQLEARQGGEMPVVAVRQVHKGRSMVVSTDATWFWNFRAVEEGQDPRLYEVFWDNAIRWLIQDPKLDLLKVRAVQQAFKVGEEAELIVTSFQADYQPAPGQPVDIRVWRQAVGESDGQEVVVYEDGSLKTDGEGRLRVLVPVAEPGTYRVEVSAQLVQGERSEATDLFLGEDRNPELERVVGDGALLEGIAAATGGVVVGFDTGPEVLPLEEPVVSTVMSRTTQDLWAAPWAMVLAALLFSLEWFLRRRYGYL